MIGSPLQDTVWAITMIIAFGVMYLYRLHKLKLEQEHERKMEELRITDETNREYLKNEDD